MSVLETATPPASGLEQMRAMMAGRRRAAMGETLDFSLVEVEDGAVTFEAAPSHRVYNPIGAVHGGFAATLLDSACGCAVHTKLSASQGYTTLELKVAYHKAMTAETGRVRAEGRVVTFGRRVAFAEARLVDDQGRLYASATSTLLVFDR